MAEFTVGLSHDVDRVHKSFQSFTHFLKYAKKGNLREAAYQIISAWRRDNYWCFDEICEIENSRGLKSTWFFLHETYPFHPLKMKSWRLALGYYDMLDSKVARMIRHLDAEGFEIGLHGSYRSYRDRALMAREKAELESIVRHPVAGIRQHYLNLCADTWSIQRSLGFLYDASFGHSNRTGFKAGVYRPFVLDRQNDFYIVPQAIMDCCLMRCRDPWQSALETIDAACRNGAFLVLNWHQQIFNEKEYPGYRRMYVRIIDECLKRNARFATLGEYVRQLAPNETETVEKVRS